MLVQCRQGLMREADVRAYDENLPVSINTAEMRK
jgi:hypothetical protein